MIILLISNSLEVAIGIEGFGLGRGESVAEFAGLGGFNSSQSLL